MTQPKVARAYLSRVLAMKFITRLAHGLGPVIFLLRWSLIRISSYHGKVSMFSAVLLLLLCLWEKAHGLRNVVAMTLKVFRSRWVLIRCRDYRSILFYGFEVGLARCHHFPWVLRGYIIILKSFSTRDSCLGTSACMF